MNFSPPCFTLGISPEKVQCAIGSLDFTTARLKFVFSPKRATSASITGASYQHTYQGIASEDKGKPECRDEKEYRAKQNYLFTRTC